MKYKLLININDENILKIYPGYQKEKLEKNMILVYHGDKLSDEEKKNLINFFKRREITDILIIDITSAIASFKNKEISVFRVKLNNAYGKSLRENKQLKREDFAKENPGFTIW